MILSGQLPAEKVGRDLMIEENNLQFVKDRRVGRPKKLGAKEKKVQ